MPDLHEKSSCYYRMMLAAGLAYIALVMPMASLGIHVTRDWGLSNFLGGLAAGLPYCAALFRRKASGDLTDRHGGKFSFVRGCVCHVAGCLLCLLAAWEALPIQARYAVLLAGRLVVGQGESMANVGMTHWVVGYRGTGRTGRTLATQGMCIYGSVAVGGRTGSYLFETFGFAGLMAATALSPLIAMLLVLGCPDAGRAGSVGRRSSLRNVFSRIWRLGFPASCVGVGFAVLGAFLTKTFENRGWAYAYWGFTLCGCGFAGMRIFIGHLPDRIGGLRVALVSAAVEMLGLYLLWLAPGPIPALIGAFLTGAGLSMIFPSLSMELINSVPGRMRGAAISCYNIFIDLSYGFAGPIAGFLIDRFGDGSAYLFAALSASVGFAMLLGLQRKWRRADDGGGNA